MVGWKKHIITLQKHAIWIRPILNIRQLITKLKINVQVLTEDIIRAHRVKADAAVVTFAAVCCVLTVVANVLAAISSVAADESIGGCKSESYNTGCILRCIGRFGACAYVFNRIASYGNVCTAGFGGFADDYDCH